MMEPVFRGLIQQKARVVKIEPFEDSAGICVVMQLTAPLKSQHVRPVIAVNGVCLTIQHVTDSQLTVTLWEKTQRNTNLGALQIGQIVNLELAEIGEILGDRAGW
jgi:riboflavin synthase